MVDYKHEQELTLFFSDWIDLIALIDLIDLIDLTPPLIDLIGFQVRENATARNIVHHEDLPWVPISTVVRADTSGLASPPNGDHETCVLFQTTMADVIAATSNRRTRRLAGNTGNTGNTDNTVTALASANHTNHTNHTNYTSAAVAVDVRWSRDLQCRYGNTGPLCANCYRYVEKKVPSFYICLHFCPII